MSEVDLDIAKLADLLSETKTQAALLQQIESLEKELDGIVVERASMESERTATDACSAIQQDMACKALRRILHDLSDNPDRPHIASHQLTEGTELSLQDHQAGAVLPH